MKHKYLKNMHWRQLGTLKLVTDKLDQAVERTTRVRDITARKFNSGLRGNQLPSTQELNMIKDLETLNKSILQLQDISTKIKALPHGGSESV